MIWVLADTVEQGRHYVRRLFPEENPATSRRVRILTPDSPAQPRMADHEAIMVGTFPTRPESWAMLRHVRDMGGDPVQGPTR